jgi:D-3-phosphoglycerate dehydrogenase
MKLLVTCKNMINRLSVYKEFMDKYDLDPHVPEFEQTVSEEKLIALVPGFDYWIIGDDQCTRKVLEAGISGNLKFAVKWGIGTDNIDFNACNDMGFHIPNTPGMFNEEVSNVALGYLLCLAHNLVDIDRQSRLGEWHKPVGTSLENKKIAVIGFGNIGQSLVRKLLALKTNVHVYDPGFTQKDNDEIICNYNENIIIDDNLFNCTLSDNINDVVKCADVMMLVCALTDSSYHMVNQNTIALMNDACYIINVSRGPVIDESALIRALKNGKIEKVALDVFESEPVNLKSELYNLNCIFGSHNSSNTKEGCDRTSFQALNKIISFST